MTFPLTRTEYNSLHTVWQNIVRRSTRYKKKIPYYWYIYQPGNRYKIFFLCTALCSFCKSNIVHHPDLLPYIHQLNLCTHPTGPSTKHLNHNYLGKKFLNPLNTRHIVLDQLHHIVPPHIHLCLYTFVCS